MKFKVGDFVKDGTGDIFEVRRISPHRDRYELFSYDYNRKYSIAFKRAHEICKVANYCRTPLYKILNEEKSS